MPLRSGKVWVIIMKKTIALISVLLLLANMISVAAANSTNADIERYATAQRLILDYEGTDLRSINKNAVQVVSRDLKLLETAHLNSLVQIDRIDTTGLVTYKIDFDEIDVVDYITVTRDANGNTVLNVKENEINNILIYSADGKSWLDGHEVTIEDPVLSSHFQAHSENEILPRAGVIHYFSKLSLPKGQETMKKQYPQFVRAQSYDAVGPILSFGQKLVTIAVSVLISLIVAKMATSAAINIGDIATTTASTLISSALTENQVQLSQVKNYHPDSKKMSYKVYGYKNKANNSLYSEFIFLFQLAGNGTVDPPYVNWGIKKVFEAT